MKRITIKDFAKQAVNLDPGKTVGFFVTNEDGVTLEHGITCIEAFNSCCLFANCEGGGRPLAVDITTYDSDLSNISEMLDKYINDGSGSFGYVNVIGENQPGNDAAKGTQGESGSHMLISVTERKISTAIFPTHKEAYAKMEMELDKTMDGKRDECEHSNDYGIAEHSAWSNADDDAISDWLIVSIKENHGPAVYIRKCPKCRHYTESEVVTGDGEPYIICEDCGFLIDIPSELLADTD